MTRALSPSRYLLLACQRAGFKSIDWSSALRATGEKGLQPGALGRLDRLGQEIPMTRPGSALCFGSSSQSLNNEAKSVSLSFASTGACGLADWCAVVALFCRRLGLPIPHAATIHHRAATSAKAATKPNAGCRLFMARATTHSRQARRVHRGAFSRRAPQSAVHWHRWKCEAALGFRLRP